MRFVADAMLGRLAKWLRLLGYDTLYWRGDDARLVRLVLAENRLLLTRDTHLPPRLPPHLTCFIESDHYDAQLGQVVTRLGLPPRIGRLCARCNLPLEPAEKTGLRGEIPEFVWQTQERFARCPGCLRIYWEGTHYARMKETIERVAATKMEPPAVDSNSAGGGSAPMCMKVQIHYPPPLSSPSRGEEFANGVPSPLEGEGEDGGDFRGNVQRNGQCD